MDDLLRALTRPAPGWLVLAAACAALIGVDAGRAFLHRAAAQRAREALAMAPRLEAAEQDAAEHRALRELKRRDVDALKRSLPHLTQSRRVAYEAGIRLQEEKRLLEKQWEILSTYVIIDEGESRLLRGEEPLESLPLAVFPPIPYGQGLKPLPTLTQVVSKERFAHPERGSYTEKDGQLTWNPPQVGPADRADALGEFVVFTRGPLILHGPAKNASEHARYPHYCLELTRDTARKLYSDSFIGAKILLKPAAKK